MASGEGVGQAGNDSEIKIGLGEDGGGNGGKREGEGAGGAGGSRQKDEEAQRQRRSQRRRNAWIIISGLFVVVGLGLGLGLGCHFRGCPAKKTAVASDRSASYSLRLLILVKDVENALDKTIPRNLIDAFKAVVQPRLYGSNIDLVDFPDLQAVEGFLLNILPQYAGKLQWYLRDFAIRSGLGDLDLVGTKDANTSVPLNVTDPTASGSNESLSALLSRLSDSSDSLLTSLQQLASSRSPSQGSNNSSLDTDLNAEDHNVLVAAAKALNTGGINALQDADVAASAGLTNSGGLPWQIRVTEADKAWAQGAQGDGVIVAVVDTGFDVNHPLLKDHLWINPIEEENGVDDDVPPNGYSDDIYGWDFAGSNPNCSYDWRSSYVNWENCTGDADVSPEPMIQDGVVLTGRKDPHGTHVAGIIAATLNQAINPAVAGASPGAKLMLLKVFDRLGKVWASNVYAAYAYAYMMKAHIVVCSFGPDAPSLAPPPSDTINQLKSYTAAAAPFQTSGTLVFAAAGNEATDLNGLVYQYGNAYLPCTLNNASLSVVCVTATNQTDKLIQLQGPTPNTVVGSNWGSRVVDFAAPGFNIWSTIPNASYGSLSGSSMATPLAAAAAALVAGVLGTMSNAPDPQDRYFQGPQVREILAAAADSIPGLLVKNNGSRINAARAVTYALTINKGAYPLTPSATYYGVNRGVSSLMAPGLREEYYQGALPAGVSAATAGTANVTLLDVPFDTTIRGPSPFGNSVLRVDQVKYNSSSTAAPGSQSQVNVLRLSGLLNLMSTGFWGLQIVGAAPLSSMRLRVGNREIKFSNVSVSQTSGTNGSASLFAQEPGYYDFELALVLNPGANRTLELRWLAPGKATVPQSSSSMAFYVPSYSRAVHPRYTPNITLVHDASTAPPAWHVMWGYAVGNAAARAALAPSFLQTVSAGVPSLSGPSIALRYTAMRPRLFPRPGEFTALVQSPANASKALANVTSPDPNTTAAVGVAVAHMRLPSAGGPPLQRMQLQVTCQSCRLYLQGVMVVDASQQLALGPSTAAAVNATSTCLNLTAAQARASSPRGGESIYTLELRFAVGDLQAVPGPGPDGGGNSTGGGGGVLDVRWRRCGDGVPSGAGPQPWANLSSLLTSAVMWAPPSTLGAYNSSALRCDLWRAANVSDATAVPSPRDTPPDASFTLPNKTYQSRSCRWGPVNKVCLMGVAQLSTYDISSGLSLTNGDNYHVRCWGFWNATFKNGVTSLRGAGTDDTTAMAFGFTFLGSQMVFKSIKQPDSLTRVSMAPLVASYSPYLQLMAFEYFNVSAVYVMGVLDGVEKVSATPGMDVIQLDSRMLVPATLP